MQSNGGVMTARVRRARRRSRCIGSGPAGGVDRRVRRSPARPASTDFISVDMGGTSYDVCLVRGGAPRGEAAWNWHHRYLIGLPMVDVQSVGAGGGSIARVESRARCRSGRRAPGAQPGPVCYGRGGTEPTVTDANLVLGYLNPDYFCGGELQLDVEGVHAAIDERSRSRSASAMRRGRRRHLPLVNANMANAIRRVSADARRRPARAARWSPSAATAPCTPACRRPSSASGASSCRSCRRRSPRSGCCSPTTSSTSMRSYITPVGQVGSGARERLFARDGARRRAAALGARQRPPRARLRHRARRRRSATRGRRSTCRCRCRCGAGRSRRVCWPTPSSASTASTRSCTPTPPRPGADPARAARSRRSRWRTSPRCRGVVAGGRGQRRGSARARRSSAAAACRRPVYDGPRSRAGQVILGPAIVEEPFTTVVVYPGQRATVDGWGNYVIAVGER